MSSRSAPFDRQGFTTSQHMRMRQADMLDGGDCIGADGKPNPKLKGTPAQCRRALAIRRQVWAERAWQREVLAVLDGIAEHEACEARRLAAQVDFDVQRVLAVLAKEGHAVPEAEVEAMRKRATAQEPILAHDGPGGAMRIRARDGLVNLYKAGHLSRSQLGVGLAYRGLYEALGSTLKSQLGDIDNQGRGAGGTSDRLVATGMLRALEAVVLTDIDRELARVKGPVHVRLLRQVAGEGTAVRALAAGGKDFAQHIKRLVDALAVAERYIWASDFSDRLTEGPH